MAESEEMQRDESEILGKKQRQDGKKAMRR